MPPDAWVEHGRCAERLMAEARASALQLGHEMTVWRPNAARAYRAECMRCGAEGWIHVRAWRAAPFTGPALSLRCTGHR